jgi:hypothetical protein
MERIRNGNPPEVLAILEKSHEKLKELRSDPKKFAQWRAARQAASE